MGRASFPGDSVVEVGLPVEEAQQKIEEGQKGQRHQEFLPGDCHGGAKGPVPHGRQDPRMQQPRHQETQGRR